MTPEKTEELRREAEQLAAVADGETALIPQGVSAEEARLELAKKTEETERAMLELQGVTERMEMELRQEVAKQREELERRVSKARGEMDAKMREMREMMAPLERQMAQLKEGIWTVNLYLGTDEQLVQLQEGEPASAEGHVYVRQLVLAMDQECAVAAEDGGLDSLDMEKFDDWLLEDWAHVEQVLPEEKGVVALVPRWDPKTHWAGWELENPERATGPMIRKQDAHLTAHAAEANQVTYFLIRNGRQLYRIAMGDFYAGDKLMPSRQEWESFFEEKNKKTGLVSKLIPGTPEWEKAEEAAGERRRHYMRVGLILQGLADRTAVFNPVPAEGVLNFLADNEYIEFIMDAENLLGPARLPFRDWQRAVNREMRPGERVVGAFESEGFRGHEYKLAHRYNETAHSRIYPVTIEERPETGRPYEIKGRKGKGLYFNFPRVKKEEQGDFYWKRREWVRGGKKGDPPDRYLEKTVAASCTVYSEDAWVIAFDRVDVEDVRYYLDSRLERHQYVDMFPVLKAILRAKELEVEEEQPYRDYLPAALAREAGVTEERAREEIDDLLSWYKFEHRRHRALAEDDVKATRAIVAEFKRRVRGEAEPMDETLVAFLEDDYPDHLIIGRKRNGRYFALTPQEEEPEGPFVHEREFYASGKIAADNPWQLIQHRADRWRIAAEGERWASWDRDAMPQEYISLPERLAITGMLRYVWGEDLLAVRFDRERRLFDIYLAGDEGTIPERLVTDQIDDVKIDEYEEEGWVRVGGQYGYASLRTAWLLDSSGGRRYKYGASSRTVKPGTPPWRETYAGYSSNAAERRDRERSLKEKNERIEAEMLYVNPDRLEALYARRGEVQAAEAEAKRLGAVARSYHAQIVRRWERDQMERIRAEFWRKHGDAAHHLWPTYVRNQVKAPGWPHDDSNRYRSHYGKTFASEDLSGALEAVVEAGLDPTGHTVREVADLARYLLYLEPDPDARSYYRRDPDQWKWEVPEDAAGYVFEELAEEDGEEAELAELAASEEAEDAELGEDPNELDDDQAEDEEYEESDDDGDVD